MHRKETIYQPDGRATADTPQCAKFTHAMCARSIYRLNGGQPTLLYTVRGTRKTRERLKQSRRPLQQRTTQLARDIGSLPNESRFFRHKSQTGKNTPNLTTLYSYLQNVALLSSSTNGFLFKQSAPTLSRPRIARNRNRYGCKASAHRISFQF